MSARRLFPLAALFAAAAAAAQAPTPWPLGAFVPWTQANNTAALQPYGLCTPTVTTTSGQVVKWGICAAVEAFLAPGETFTSHWNQTDENGLPVPPGTYLVGGRPFAIGASNTGLSMLGDPHVGVARHVELTAPGQAGAPFVLAASFTATGGIALGCGLVFPIDADALLAASIGGSPFFPNFLGVLDQDGRTNAPAVVLPNQPWLIGVSFELAFLTIDPLQPCGIGRVSAAATNTTIV